MSKTIKLLSIIAILSIFVMACGTNTADDEATDNLSNFDKFFADSIDEIYTAEPDAPAIEEPDPAEQEAEIIESITDTLNDETSTNGYNNEDPIALKVYSQLSSYVGEQTGWFAQLMLEKFNVKLYIVNDATVSSDFDIMVFGDEDQYIDAINNANLLDWNKDQLFTEYGAYIKDNMSKALEKNMSISPDGKLYGFGNSVARSVYDHESFFYHPDIRWDLYKQLGYPSVNTLEDLVDLLADMKRICPESDSGKETYGVSLFSEWDGSMVMFVKATAALYGYDEFGIGLYDVESQEWQGALQEGGMYLRCLKFYNDLYQRNLLDPDSLTQGYDGAYSDYEEGAAFFNIFNYMASYLYNTDDHISQDKAMYALALGDQKTLTYGLNVLGGNRIWTIGANTQYPELCLSIINWLATPEGRMTAEYGPKGISWDYDENKKPYLTELGLSCMANMSTQMSGGYSGSFADGLPQINNTTWDINTTNPDSDGESYNYKRWVSYNEPSTSNIMNDWRAFTGFTTADEYLSARPHAVSIYSEFTEVVVKSEELSTKWERVASAIKDYSWQAIYAATDEEYNSIVAEMIVKTNEYGYNECVEYCLEEAARRKEAEDRVK